MLVVAVVVVGPLVSIIRVAREGEIAKQPAAAAASATVACLLQIYLK